MEALMNKYDNPDQAALESIRNPEGLVEGDVITKFMKWLITQTQIQIAFLHPNYTASFYAINENVLSQIKENPTAYPASEYLHGYKDFEILLVPFHIRQRDSWQGGEHWMLGIYDKQGLSGQNFFYLYDPKPKKDGNGKATMEEDHRCILRHILKTIKPGIKLQGTITLPRGNYNMQPDDDYFSCGVYVCYYAREYITNRIIRFFPEFLVQEERRSIAAVVEAQQCQLPVINVISKESLRLSQTTANLRIHSSVEFINEETRLNKRKRDADRRSNETLEVQVKRRVDNSKRMTQSRAEETPEEIEIRRSVNRIKMTQSRTEETPEEIEIRQSDNRTRMSQRRTLETVEQTERRRAENRRRMARLRAARNAANGPMYKAAMDSNVTQHRLSSFNVECSNPECTAIHYSEEQIQNFKGTFSDCCGHGKVELEPNPIPKILEELFLKKHRLSKVFLENIRRLNSSLSFASINAINKAPPKGIYSFAVQGTMYHRFKPTVEQSQDEHGKQKIPLYGALYYLDPTEAVNHRLSYKNNNSAGREIFELLERIIRSVNEYAQAYKMMKEVEEEMIKKAELSGIEPPQLTLVFDNQHRKSLDRHRFNVPAVNEVAAVVVLNADQSLPNVQLVVHKKNAPIDTMNNLSNLIEPFVYPLFFPTGAKGYNLNIPYRYTEGQKKKKFVTRAQFTRFRIAVRRLNGTKQPEIVEAPTNAKRSTRLATRRLSIGSVKPELTFNPIHFGGPLFLQWCIDSWIRVEKDKLNFIKAKQQQLKANCYSHVNKYLEKRAKDQNVEVSGKVILPSSFTGSPRWYSEQYHDAMALVQRFGMPDYFITVTCNPKWPEITEVLRQEFTDGTILEQASNLRPDIIARVFKLKLDQLIKDLNKNKILGKSIAYAYTIEFQKRGLPHAHILLIMSHADKPQNPEEIDDFISAEIPEDDQELRKIILEHNMHKPCGHLNPDAPCMVTKGDKETCRFKFPKDYCEETRLVEDQMPQYRRRYKGKFDQNNKEEFQRDQAVMRRDKYKNTLFQDNRHVAPYNPYLSKKYNCHINVEYVGTIKSVKYLYKYIYKGADCADIKVVGDEYKLFYDEASHYVSGRYYTAPEACWRLFEFEIQEKSHKIERLDIHLEGKFRQNLEQQPEDLADMGQKGSTLEAFFKLNKKAKEEVAKGDLGISAYKKALELLYWQIPEYFTWHPTTSEWKPILQLNKPKIGRIYNISACQPDLHYCRTLLLKTKEPTCHKDLLIVPGRSEPCKSYKEACVARGLAKNDQQWKDALNESKLSKVGRAMRTLFVTILTNCEPENPLELWEMFKEDLAEDFIRFNNERGIPKEGAIDRAYRIIATGIQEEAKDGRLFKDWVTTYGFPDVNSFEVEDHQQFISASDAAMKGQTMYANLNPEQKSAVDAILDAANGRRGGSKCFFIDGPGGTGKTYVYKCLYYLLTGENKRCKNMATTGIAATLLSEGKTAHKTFSLNVPLAPDSTSKIKKGSKEGNQLAECDVFFLDEAPMLPRYGMENMDEKLQELNECLLPFGGSVQVYGGDFRQCLPVQPRANNSELMDLSIKNSLLWHHFNIFKLNKNQRVDKDEVEFAKFLLDLGDGNLTTNDLDEIQLDEEFKTTGDLVEDVFGLCFTNYDNWENEVINRAILTPLNATATLYNDTVHGRIPETEIIYTSIDTIKNQMGGVDFTNEYLWSRNPADLPPHELKLKKNSIIMLIRNIRVDEGQCNGTRLIVMKLEPNIIVAKILTGEHRGKEAHIPRMTLETDKGLGFTMERHQFPIKPAFAMTIHKSQGQTFEFIGIDLTTDVFTHGQLYVAFSRIKNKKSIKVIFNPIKAPWTKNLVLKQMLD